MFEVWWQNGRAFTAVAALLELPLLALELRAGKGARASPLLPLFEWIINVLAVGAMSHGVLEAVAERRATVGGMLRMLVGRLWPVFAVSAVYWALILIAAFPGIPLILPGVLVLVIGFVCVPAVLAEPELGTVGALQRSMQLTQGHRLTLFWALLAVFGLYAVMLIGVQAVLDGFPSLPFPAYAAVFAAVDAFLTGISGTCAGVAYHQLRAVQPAASEPSGF